MTCLDDFQALYTMQCAEADATFSGLCAERSNHSKLAYLAGLDTELPVSRYRLENVLAALFTTPLQTLYRRCLQLNLPARHTLFLLKHVSKMQIQKLVHESRTSADLSQQERASGITCLMTAVTMNFEVGTFMLLQAGANRDVKNANGDTAFDIVANLCAKQCGLNCLDCKHAHIRALLVMRTSHRRAADDRFYQLALARET